MRKIKNVFKRKSIDNILRQIAEADRNALLTEKDVEYLKSIGVETDLETLQKGGKKN